MAEAASSEIMKKTSYHLDRRIRLIQTSEGFFCLSTFPLNAIRINAPLFHLLKQMENGRELEAESIGLHESSAIEQLVRKRILQRKESAEPEQWPSVSVIIPVKDRAHDLRECIESLMVLDYPADKLEILVVDDGSSEDVIGEVRSFPVKTYRMPSSIGQSACRNFAAQRSKGEILAFLDSDCTVTPRWLKEQVPLFSRPKIGAVGGYIEGFYNQTLLDRYEKGRSPLNMGQREQESGDDSSPLYVPSCNLLVTRDIFFLLRGFREDFRVGEDVDFCWRLRKLGKSLLYHLKGKVYHKHRNRLVAMLKRRFDYGTSEASLLNYHSDKSKEMDISLRERALFIAVCFLPVFFSLWMLIPIAFILCWDFLYKIFLIRRKKIPVPGKWTIFSSTLRWSFFSLYKISYFITRYYLLLLLLLGLFFPRILFLAALFFAVTTTGTLLSKRTTLSPIPFSFFFIIEQIAYQLGVLKGCLQARNWKPFFLRITSRKDHQMVVEEEPSL